MPQAEGATAADLARFRNAQARVHERVLDELRSGRKRSHWMWFIFPQLGELGHSPTAKYYGIANLDEARAYLADPVLGERLTECANALLQHDGRVPEEILGPVDALKLRSSATLFREAGGGPTFQAVLDSFFGGDACPVTLSALREDDD